MDIPRNLARTTSAVTSLAHTLGLELAAGATALTCPFTPPSAPTLRPFSAREDERPHRRVVVVHGYGSNSSVWHPLVQRLHTAGIGGFWAFQYNCGKQTLPELAEAFAARLSDLPDEPMHLVGHSLGGLVIRYAVVHFGVEALSASLIASPQRGAHLAYLGLGSLAVQLRPKSPVLRALERRTAPAMPWTAYYSSSDVVVPPQSAALSGASPLETNVRISGRGHMSILRSKELAADLAIRVERAAAEKVARTRTDCAA